MVAGPLAVQPINLPIHDLADIERRRGGAKENAELQSTVQTQSREAVSQAQARIPRSRQQEQTGQATARSTSSAAAEAALFARFSATSGRSDFSFALIVGYGLRPSQCGPGHDWWGQRDLPVPGQKASAHARVCDDAGLAGVLR